MGLISVGLDELVCEIVMRPRCLDSRFSCLAPAAPPPAAPPAAPAAAFSTGECRR